MFILLILFINLLLKRNNYLLLIINTEIILLYLIFYNIDDLNFLTLAFILLLFAAIEGSLLLFILFI